MKKDVILKQSNFWKINHFLLILLLIPSIAWAEKDSQKKEHEGVFDPSELINHHIADAHSWEIFHDFVVHLPVIIYSKELGFDIFSSSHFYDEDYIIKPYKGYVIDHEHITLESGADVFDISITKNVLFLFINSALLILIFLSVANGYKKNKNQAPKGIQSFFEPLIIFIRDDVAKSNIGRKYERFMPFLLTVFFFIWFGNILGLLPGAANLTGNISITLVLSVLTLFFTLISGRKTYWLHIVDPLGKSMPLAGKLLLYLILWPVEIIGIFTKPFALMIRLFANITAGHILILSIISLAFIFESLAVGVVGAVFATVMNMLELFVAMLQAYVFTLLSAMYFGQAVEEHH